MDGVSKKQKKEEDDQKKKLEEQLKVLFISYFGINITCLAMLSFLVCSSVFIFCFLVHLQNQSQLIWGIKDKLKKFCSTNDMKELLIANGQEVPSGESNVRPPRLISLLPDSK